MSETNLTEMIAATLKKIGADGFRNRRTGCQCLIDDVVSCGDAQHAIRYCVPISERICPCCGEKVILSGNDL